MISIQISGRGTKGWRLHWMYHRDNGPAVIYLNNQYQAWWQHGQLHRTDGPARIHIDGSVEYWIKGKQVSEYELMFINESCV